VEDSGDVMFEMKEDGGKRYVRGDINLKDKDVQRYIEEKLGLIL
jgi:hypothetical protein